MLDNEGKMETISIIVPVFNVEKYVRRSVESIINSSYKHIEVILVDDGSNDASLSICLALKEQYDCIKVIHQDNTGCTGARKLGLSYATGKYIGFVDPDDWIEPDMFETLYQEAEKNDSDMVVSNYYRDNNLGTYGVFKSTNLPDGVYAGDKIEAIKTCLYENGRRTINGALWNKLFRRDQIQSVYKALDDRIYRGEDSVAVVLYLLQCKRLSVINRPLYHAYDRSTSLTHNVDIEHIAQINYWYKQVYEYAVRNNYTILLRGLEDFYVTSLSEALLKHVRCGFYFKCHDSIIDDKRLILYGAGQVGRSYYEQLIQKGVEIILWIDRNADKLNDERIKLPERICEYSAEKVLIAVEAENVADEIKKELIEKYHVDKERIKWSKPDNFVQMIRSWIYDPSERIS